MKIFYALCNSLLLCIFSFNTILFAQNAGFDAITLAEIKSASLSSAKINGSNNRSNKIPAGTILLYRTNEGRYGKLLIRKYDYNLTLRWKTYNSNGSVYSKGDNLIIRGTWSCDLDLGKQSSQSADFWWEQVTAIERYLVPKNRAKFAIFQGSKCSVQGIKRIYTSKSKVKCQVQYYIPPSHPNACFISAYIPNKKNQSSSFRYNPAGRKPYGVPKGQHYFTDNIVFEAEYIGSQSYTSATIEVVIYDKDRNLCSSVINWGQTWGKPLCPKSYSYINNYPKDRENGWSDNLNGVTHDKDNWFFTQEKTLWKFPVTHNLNNKVTRANPSKGILKVGIPGVLKNMGYNHFGDLDYCDGYLFIPMTGKPKRPCIAVFSASNLRYIDLFVLERQGGAGWCAINPVNNLLYTSNSTLSSNDPIYRYSVDFNKLKNNNIVHLQYNSRFRIYDESGRYIKLKNMQGGVFSDIGCLYTVNGYCTGSTENTGIMVFDGQTGRRIAKSTNGSGEFDFEYHPGSSFWPWEVDCKEEPEGITIWDLDSGRAPRISGQIHVIMIDNYGRQPDDLYFKHYRILR